MIVESNRECVSVSAEKLFGMISDCRHLEKMVAPHVTRCEATENECSISMAGKMDAKISIIEKIAPVKVVYKLENDKNIPANVIIDIEPVAESSNLSISVDAAIPDFMAVMVKKPIRQALDRLMSMVKTQLEKI